MNKIKKIFITAAIGAICFSMNSCKDDFVDINSDERTIFEIEPERFLYKVQSAANGWEYHWDFCVGLMPWLQYGVATDGNSETQFEHKTNIWKQRYEQVFMRTGQYMRHMEYLVTSSEASDTDKARYQPAIEVARINLIYYAMYTSDVYGSLAYTQGWSLRSGGEINEPEFESQETLFGIWDNELKNAINVIKSTNDPVSIANYDMAFQGDWNKWIKAANALRLRLALRYMKRDMAKAKSIAAEVLGSSEVPSSTDDSFVIWLSGMETDHEDFYSIADMIRPSETFMGYLKKYDDPRKRIFFRINNLTPENIAQWSATNPGDDLSGFSRWEGLNTSYDDNSMAKWVNMRKSRTMGEINMTPLNRPQTRLNSGRYDKGNGGSWFPRLTYADFCFMAAEFVLDGVASSKTAEQWYTEGVRSSLELWSKVGSHCQIHDYEAITETEISKYMEQEGIKWNPSIGKEQIYAQTYVEHYKNLNESHALYRRVGYPNTTSPIISTVEPYANGVKQDVPRRFVFSKPLEGTTNYDNEMKRLNDMAADPDFGALDNEYGRIWWDKK